MDRGPEKVDEEALSSDSAQSQIDAEKQADSTNIADDVPVPVKVNPMHPSQFPDGGLQAWLVVFGGFIGLIVSFGWINCEWALRSVTPDRSWAAKYWAERLVRDTNADN